jgi:hypothetical protein
MVTDWARSRSLGSSSVGGISLALALCAAGWFTAGTRSDNFRAVAALWTAYLAMLAARSLVTRPDHDELRARGTVVAGPSAVARTRWLAVLAWGVSESACYAGLAEGAAAERWAGVWPLAIAVLSLIAVRDLMTACSRPGGNALAQGGIAWRTVNLFLTMPAGGRVLLIGIVAPAWGGRAALFALLDWAIIAVGYGLAAQVGSPARVRAAVSQPRPPDRAPWPGSLVILLSPSGQDMADLDQDEIELAGPGPAGYGRTPGGPADAALALRDGTDTVPGARPDNAFGMRPDGDVCAGPDSADGIRPAAGPDGADGIRPAAGPDSSDDTRPAATPAAGPGDRPAAVPRQVRLRDDGVLARRLGKPVRGNLLPLPPAALGLAATATLAYLGLRSLPGVLILAPVLIMLLVAAPGSSNRHSGRFDWLVPAVLLGWQFLYVAAVGEAVAVRGPVTFLLCTALLLRYADLAFPGRPVMLARPGPLSEPFRERGGALGWEGRMLLVGIGAAIGIGTFAYLALTAYLVLLLFAKVLTSCPWLREVDGR